MQKNDIFQVEIMDIGVDGEGIGKYEGITFFIKDAVVGDLVEAKITKLKKNYGYARVEKIIKPSSDRVELKCSIAKRCGGCQIQQVSYQRQLKFKEDKVKNNLIRIGKFTKEEIESVFEPIVGMDDPFRYRNKAQYPVGMDKEGNIVTGFYAQRSHDIISIENNDCKLGITENAKILDLVKEYMQENSIKPYNENTKKGLVRHILIRKGFDTNQIMVCLIINGDILPKQEKLIEKLKGIQGMTSISINKNKENTNVILGKETVVIWGESYIKDFITLNEVNRDKTGRISFQRTDKKVGYQISAQSFFQVNPQQTEKLYSLALDYAGLKGEESVWDLYCGIGTISLFLANKAKNVYGVEIVEQAIEDAKRNAKLNNINNAKFFVGKAEDVISQFYQKNNIDGDNTSKQSIDTSVDEEMMKPDIIVVDPPRKGCDNLCLDTILNMAPPKIVYVSCDSATLARDLRYLCEGGYELKKVCPVDQFAQTTHVETVVLLTRVN
ncbi:23S rRNA (uracil(1939)-C(5))-methyltransferase RlmD [Lachnobacterium bovis]|uniref:23S rRNA (Uracil1939-C5)-methyltransferase n=1 Tax=Lachnobacterium bovis TaxID=140626 RepID=A0A1H9TKF9_9FIRM|nr:23S rRNA (uracil(1939)-C(5))-methyltransferase RlmD [Lachnobacterium bovis]SER97582.1 23S rRNA (uracil1939-C5)-methyltransferase [Lachnobacterium bovis]